MKHPKFILSTLATIFLLLIVLACAQAVTSRERVEFPQNYREDMNLYAVVDRIDGKVYEIFVNDTALESWRDERILPNGTTFVIESFNAQQDDAGNFLRDERGRLIKGESEFEIHVNEKRSDWASNDEITSTGLLSGNETGNGQWRVSSFDPRTGLFAEPANGDGIQACHTCHLERRAEDFVLSRGLLDNFVRTGTPSYISFNCTEREICFGTP
jgi:hypothetical protein